MGCGQQEGSKSLRNSLTVNVISPSGAGAGVALDRGGHCQERMGAHGQGDPAVPRLPAPDVCWSIPTSPLAVWKDSSMRQRCPATVTRVCSGTGLGL